MGIEKYEVDDIGYYASDKGEWYKVKDVEYLIQAKIEKLSIQNGDVLIISPLEGQKWSEQTVKHYLELIREIFQPNSNKVMFVVTGNQKIEIKRV